MFSSQPYFAAVSVHKFKKLKFMAIWLIDSFWRFKNIYVCHRGAFACKKNTQDLSVC